ncbi:hypothetical protein ACJX0J_027934, partial [Zea mays]
MALDLSMTIRICDFSFISNFLGVGTDDSQDRVRKVGITRGMEIVAKKDPINEPYNVGDDYNSDTDEDSKLGYKTFLSIEMEMTLPYIHGVPGTSKTMNHLQGISNRYFCLLGLRILQLE